MDDPHRRETMLRAPLGHSVMLMFGIFAAPLAWALQLVTSYALASSSCFSRGVAKIADDAVARLPIAIIAAVCVLVAVAGMLVALQQHRSAGEMRALPHAARTRSLATVGILSSLLFLGAIAFSIVMLSMSPGCAG